MAVRDQFARRNFGKKIELVETLVCSRESVLHVYKNPYEIGRKMDIYFHGRLSGVLQSMILDGKSTSACQGYFDSIDGATLFSKIVSNKLRGNVKNEIALICAKFGADLVSTSKSYKP